MAYEEKSQVHPRLGIGERRGDLDREYDSPDSDPDGLRKHGDDTKIPHPLQKQASRPRPRLDLKLITYCQV